MFCRAGDSSALHGAASTPAQFNSKVTTYHLAPYNMNSKTLTDFSGLTDLFNKSITFTLSGVGMVCFDLEI